MKKTILSWLSLLLCVLLLSGCAAPPAPAPAEKQAAAALDLSAGEDSIPAYSGSPYIVLNQNQPDFSEEDKNTQIFEQYSPLDSLGRCGPASACLGPETLPDGDRESISQIHPSGWQSVQYDCVDGKSLYNRCHLIGFQLSGENANAQNLITGTRYLNIEGMLPFENMTADYIRETGNHVLYRVTPVFTGNNLVADGVRMEGWSVEDQGEGICFHVYCYNVQPGIEISYSTGDSRLAEETAPADQTDSSGAQTYILNTNTRRFHLPSCSSAKDIKTENRREYRGSREELIKEGYEPCGNCSP